MSIIIDEEEFGLVLAESQFGGILPVPVKCFLYGAIFIVYDLAIFFLVLIAEEAIIPTGSEGSPGIRENASFLTVHFEDGIFFLILSADEDIAPGGDVDIAGVFELYGKGDREEFIPGSVYLEGSDGDFSLGILDFGFEEGEDCGTTIEGGFALFHGVLSFGTGEDEGIVVSEGGGIGDIEGSGEGLPFIRIDGERVLGEMYPGNEVIAWFGIEEFGGTLFSIGLELHDRHFQCLGIGSLILDTDRSRDTASWLDDEVDRERGSDEAEVTGGLCLCGDETEKQPNEEEG